MAKTKKVDSVSTVKKLRPALTPEARESQLISLAYDVAEEQLLNRTASSQIIAQFLKMGTAKSQLELEKLRHENGLIKAKTEAMESVKHIEELYANALKAMKTYQGDMNE